MRKARHSALTAEAPAFRRGEYVTAVYKDALKDELPSYIKQTLKQHLDHMQQMYDALEDIREAA
ncbi:MAG: hypothetical protein ACFB51_03355 [Anaerolineae bacterium]